MSNISMVPIRVALLLIWLSPMLSPLKTTSYTQILFCAASCPLGKVRVSIRHLLIKFVCTRFQQELISDVIEKFPCTRYIKFFMVPLRKLFCSLRHRQIAKHFLANYKTTRRPLGVNSGYLGLCM